MSWAGIASKPAGAAAASASDAPANPAEHKTCVLDANALISGNTLNIHSYAEKFYTIQEVFDEIRDKQSRQYLNSLPFSIEVKECSEESLRAGVRYTARRTDG
jgi:RNA-binding protein NOB1